jgi:hypothetical protein
MEAFPSLRLTRSLDLRTEAGNLADKILCIFAHLRRLRDNTTRWRQACCSLAQSETDVLSKIISSMTGGDGFASRDDDDEDDETNTEPPHAKPADPLGARPSHLRSRIQPVAELSMVPAQDQGFENYVETVCAPKTCLGSGNNVITK